GIPNVDLYYLEGDERIYIDGAASPSYHGTGTEETFNGAWYSPLGQDGPFVHALCGYSGHVTNFSIPELKRSFYRLYIMDPIVFSNRLRYQLEHGPKNDMNANYETVSFYYIKRSPALVQTDSLDEGDPVSESQHNYTFTDSAPIIELTSKYVGDSTVQPLYDRGRAILGSSGFDANLTPDNHGVLLRCRADHETGRVSAMVSVDGIDVGIWYQATWNPYARWVDREFKIPANFTAGRQRIRIQIRPLGPGEWRSFFFSVYCFNY
ncbi:MAG: DUF2961 domain-containing protein, partial [Planctomycetes bacterium]|nr:DUF2961 domain-containing protein [Planctomycetota bacterium]